MVSGNYQSGISVIDLTNPANAREIAYADPAPLVDPNPPVGIELGGDWSTYWYTAASTSPTSRAASSSGTSAIGRSPAPGSSTT
jgi:hypothetical protein